MKTLKLLLFSIVVLFSISFVSALSLQNQTHYEVNTSLGDDDFFIIEIYNDQSMTFYNITIEDNDYISMDKIDKLEPGEKAIVEVSIDAIENFNGDLSIKGFYESNLGTSNQTHQIDIDYNNGIEPCNLNIIEGDSVRWNNFVNDDIVINAPYSMFGGTNTIPEGESKTHDFPNPEVFSYTFSRRGYLFTDSCEINVLSSEGLIHNSDYDAVISLNIIVTYPPTQMSMLVLTKEFNITAYETKEGALTLANMGSETAKNVRLSGKWMSFNKNNFDLAPGETTPIIYSITPEPTNSNQTNQTYQLMLQVEGNFPMLEQNLSVYVPYMKIGDNFYGSGQSLQEWIDEQCELDPTLSYCEGNVKVVYRSANDSEFNVSMSISRLNGLWEFQFDKYDEQEQFNDLIKETIYDQKNLTDVVTNQSLTNSQSIQEVRDDVRLLAYIAGIAILLLATLVISSILSWIIYQLYKFNNLPAHLKYQWKNNNNK